MALGDVYDDEHAMRTGFPMTREDFDRLIAQSTDYRYEWADGRIYLVPPPSPQHIFLADGILVAFKELYGFKGPCRPYRGQYIELPPYEEQLKGAVKQPDVIVSCAHSDFFQKREKGRVSSYARYPRIIVEVLSEDSTAQADRTTKFNLYKQLPSLETYMLFSQTEMEVAVFRRETGWKTEAFSGDMEIPLGPEGNLRLAEVYRGVLDQEE